MTIIIMIIIENRKQDEASKCTHHYQLLIFLLSLLLARHTRDILRRIKIVIAQPQSVPATTTWLEVRGDGG